MVLAVALSTLSTSLSFTSLTLLTGDSCVTGAGAAGAAGTRRECQAEAEGRDMQAGEGGG